MAKPKHDRSTPPKPKPRPKPKPPPRRKGIYRTYSDEEKAAALVCLDANGGNVLQTAKDLDIPYQTLTEWSYGRVNPAVTQLQKETRSTLANMFRGFIHRVLSSITDAEIKILPVDKRLVAAGIATDKQQLLDGDATSISGQSELTDAELLERLRRIAAQRTGRTQPPPAIEQAPAPGTAADRPADHPQGG